MKNVQQVNQYLADLSVWNVKLHNLHFNVTGPQFKSIHEYRALADLIVVDGNALEDIKVLTDPGKNMLLIMKDGKIYKNDL